jgi:hypothetical protein
MKERFSILLLILLPILTYGIKGDSESKQTIVKEFTTVPGTALRIANKYGKIIVHTWSKDETKATIVITGFGKTVEEAKSIREMVNIEMNKSGNNIELETRYNPSGNSNKWFSWGGKKESKDYVNIDYELFVPEKLGKLILENNFGDVITDVLSFPVVIGINYCTYDIKEARKSLEVNMNYCDKGRIGKAESVTIKANYSNIKSDAITSLTTKSNYCDYKLGTVGTLMATGNYDGYTIAKVGSVTIKSTYTDFRIDEVQSEINAKLVYGDFSAKTLGTGFKGADMQVTYTDVKIGVPQRLGVQIKVNLTNGDVRTPELSLKTVSNIKKNSLLIYSATTVNGDDGSPLVNIHGIYSDVRFESR